MQTQGNIQAPTGALRTSRAAWIESFASAMLALNPHWGTDRAERVARELWADVGHFDPVLAAELEYESSLCDA